MRSDRAQSDNASASPYGEVGSYAALHACLKEKEPVYPRVPLGHERADACLKGGILCGALHEVYAAEAGDEPAACGFAAALAIRVSRGKKLLWICQDFSVFEFGDVSATGFLELGLDPARMLLLRVGDAANALRAAGDALSCAALGAVVVEMPGMTKKLDLVASRRLTLAAAKKGVNAFLLRFAVEPDASTAETRWLVGSAHSSGTKEDWGFPRFTAALIRNRHGATGGWVMEWNVDGCVFREPAYRGTVVSLSGDRPAAGQTVA